ncbi:helix-turn-helix domain-containing protein [Chlamydia gallinacea]|uniref:DNA-binding protein n=2 Tax=Chlamydia gallinacea TaxID=1457153 RepID=A0A173DZI1_9CHLA|nr:RodZ family helix-turn-helix domain-containing protein [Chlamydia gallinacea]EYE62985.1 helix-turn-helix domain protein [Bacteroides fragilis str. S6L5]ANG66341.1 DNA-binding protein [Chlamydia gallinacea 08-1274/3]AQT77457.1 DNA-binding protein [Chlamydia gallinacea]MBX6680447.1 helix-turn-helix domain-containing protein [Chlamydia gallinacea]MBX6687074.1 helix-turn-helix domain-containing protein [Chlamydia gallinacea]
MTEHIHQELVHLGEIFRNKREEKSLSLKDVETATAIRCSCLEAIENGCLGKLISPVYAQGFIKKYAAYLGLDSERILQEHPYVIKIFKEFSEHNMEMLLDLESMGGRNSPEQIIRGWSNLWWAALIVGSIVTIWWLGSRLSIF